MAKMAPFFLVTGMVIAREGGQVGVEQDPREITVEVMSGQ